MSPLSALIFVSCETWKLRTPDCLDGSFVVKDVCRVFGLDNNREAVSNLDDDEKITVSNPDGNPRGSIPHTYMLISESGLYSLIFRSRKPEVKRFRNLDDDEKAEFSITELRSDGVMRARIFMGNVEKRTPWFLDGSRGILLP